MRKALANNKVLLPMRKTNDATMDHPLIVSIILEYYLKAET